MLSRTLVAKQYGRIFSFSFSSDDSVSVVGPAKSSGFIFSSEEEETSICSKEKGMG